MPAGQANFDGDGVTLDTSTTLATGAKMSSTTLAANIDSSQEYLTLNDPIDISREGGAVYIDDETIWVLSFDPDYPTQLEDLVRGRDGTSAASHTAGAAVVVAGKDRYHNPARTSAIITMQETINDLLARVTALETP